MKSPQKRLEEAVRKVGKLNLDLDMVLRRIVAGESKQKLGAELGIHPRWLSDLNPLIEQKQKEEEAAKVQAGETDADDLKTSMAVARRLASQKLPLNQRINIWTAIAKDKELPASQRMEALKRIDDLTGIIPSKTAMEPDPPPMFALPENTEIELRDYSTWLLSRKGDRGPQGNEVKQ